MSLLRASIIATLLVLGGCAGLDEDPTRDWSAEKFYNEAKSALDSKNYAAAIKHFEKLEARYPYGAYSEQAQLELAYAYYKDDDAASAIAAAERFIRLHPTHVHADYAYYIKGRAHVEEQGGIVGWLRGGNDLSDRDPKALREGYETFAELLTRFPASRYADDARARMRDLVTRLARYEVGVAQFYFDKKAYVAAASRAKYVVENFQRTIAVEDALALQARAYRALGLNDLMQDSVRVLALNFPQSRYLAEFKPG